jgi:diguanylate cyclase (GGDEF)-like protein
MMIPRFPDNESYRVSLLNSIGILDTGPDERFDRLTRIAQRLFNVPVALVSLIDSNRQWFKSCIGLNTIETSRDISFCGHAILGDDIFLINDAKADGRFADNPLVTGEPHIRFYAGFPLSLTDEVRVGTLCLADTVPRQFSAQDLQLLRDLGNMAQQELRSFAAATLDHLTGLLNRRGFLPMAERTLELCRRTQSSVVMLYCDLNEFKTINDRFGHAEGDHVLKVFADILRSTFRSCDVVARLGGDEFVALLVNTDAIGTSAAIRRIEEQLASNVKLAGRGYSVGCSIGSATFEPGALSDIETMLSASDKQMYATKAISKKQGRS